MSASRKITLGSPYITDLEKKYVNQALDQGKIAPGEFTQRAQQQILEKIYPDHKYCVLLNSGQSALRLCLLYMKHHKNAKKVGVPAITYISTLAAVWQAGLKPVLLDVSPSIQNRISCYLTKDVSSQAYQMQEIDTIIPVHLFGESFAQTFIARDCPNLNIIQDACESIGSQQIGHSDAVCLSFYPSHIIGAGLGGAIVTNNFDLYRRCWQMVNHGRVFQNQQNSNVSDRFTFDYYGASLKFCDLNAALLLAQIQRFDEIKKKHVQNGNTLIKMFKQQSMEMDFFLPNGSNHHFMMFPLVLKGHYSRHDRNIIVNRLNDAGIDTRMFMPIIGQEAAELYCGPIDLNRYQNALYYNNHGFYFGCHADLTKQDLTYVVKILKKIMEEFNYGK